MKPRKALRSIKVKKAPGPDKIPNIILKSFVQELALVLCDIYNISLRQGILPPLMKSAIVRQLPKVRPARSIENDIRPVSLTCQIAKVIEGLTLNRTLPLVLPKLDPKQFASVGSSTVHAFFYLLHLALEALDKGNCTISLFFGDFKKGFDLIDHHILISKLQQYSLHPCLIRWVAAFLQGRSQCVKLASSSSMFHSLNGGIPQGTRLGPLLFAIMVNDLARNWGPRAKYVDDLTLFEIIPRNSPSLMRYLVNDVNQFAQSNNMKLNPKKCKIMRVDFLRYNSCSCQPIAIGGSCIESVTSFKLLGVFISTDLSWLTHCDYVIKKANRRLYALRKLRGCGVPASDIVIIYCSLIRSVLEYASVVFANLPRYLSLALEKVQKRALTIIFGPALSYEQALAKAGITSLEVRREQACRKFIASIAPESVLFPLIRNRRILNTAPYSLRSGAQFRVAKGRTNRLNNFVTVKYV